MFFLAEVRKKACSCLQFSNIIGSKTMATTFHAQNKNRERNWLKKKKTEKTTSTPSGSFELNICFDDQQTACSLHDLQPHDGQRLPIISMLRTNMQKKRTKNTFN